MTTGESQETRRRRLARLAWVLLLLAPLLLLEGYYLRSVAHFQELKGISEPFARLAGLACWVSGFGAVTGFVGLSLKYGKPPGPS